jgi:hypothetical protein
MSLCQFAGVKGEEREAVDNEISRADFIEKSPKGEDTQDHL